MEEEWEFLLIDARNAFNESDTPRMAVRSTVLLQLLPTSTNIIDAHNAFNESDTPRMAVRSTVLLQLLPTSCTLG